MKYYSNETAKNLVLLQVEANKKAIALIPEIKKVLEKFNGKTVNKRFDTALKSVDDALSFETVANSFIISMRIDNRRVTSEKYCEYLEYSKINILHECIRDGDKPERNAIIFDNEKFTNVFSMGYLIKRLDETAKELTNANEVTILQLKDVEKLQQEQKAILKQIEDFNRKLNHPVSSYFNLDIKIQY